MKKKFAYECEPCRLWIDKFVNVLPKTKTDIELCEQEGWKFLARKPRTPEQRKQAKWCYTQDDQSFFEIEFLIDDSYWSEPLCSKCRKWIGKKFRKEFREIKGRDKARKENALRVLGEKE